MGKQFHETLLHWIWKQRQLTNPLKTTEGKTIIVHHPGHVNLSDGPDFINAKITIGSLTWHGHVEIHWKAQDWFRHDHNNDSNYNNVVLHVVFEEVGKNQLQPEIPTLCIKPFLNKSLSAFFEGFQTETRLHCARNLSFISPAALEAQISKAHKEYFEQKADDLLHFYDSEAVPSEAWQKMTIIAFFDGLGILNNREPMQKLAQILLNKYPKFSSLSDIKKIAFQEAFDNEKYNWKRKGSRPANHPKPRINQACDLLWYLKQTPFNLWFDTNIKQSFEKCMQNIGSNPKVGKERAGVLYGTVWLPAVYLLGELFGSSELTTAAREAWMQHRTSLPASVRRPFSKSGVPEFIYRQN